jgi:hypothetical protein
MPVCEERDDSLATDGLVGELAADLGTEGYRDVDSTGAQRRRHARVPHLLGQQLHVRVGRPKRLPQGGQRNEARAPAERYAQAAQLARGRTPCVNDAAIELGERGACAIQEGAPRVRQAHVPSRSCQELRAKLPLELADRDAQRRLCHVQPLGGPAEVEFLRHATK